MSSKPSSEKKEAIRITCTGTMMVDVDNLVPFQGKFKKLDKANYEKLRGQILAVGITAAATVWKHEGKLYLLDGHQRREAIQRMKAEGHTCPPIPVNFADCRTKAEAKVKVLALASTYGSVDPLGLSDFAKEAGLNMTAIADSFRFPDIDLNELVRSAGATMLAVRGEQEVPAPPKKPRTKPGDIWTLGRHRLICGDSTELATYERLMGKGKATLVFTDPPYGVSIGKKNAMLNKQKGGRSVSTDIENDALPPEELKGVLLQVFNTAKAFMADDCSIFVCSPQGGGLSMMMMMMMQEAGLKTRHIINWVKNSPTFSMGRLDYDYQHEPILFTWTKTHKRKKAGAFQTSLWTVDKPRSSKLHPTMKPVELPTCAILNHTDDGDLVLDNFGGSGTTLIACEQTGRACRMVELTPAYCDVIVARWEAETGKKAVKA